MKKRHFQIGMKIHQTASNEDAKKIKNGNFALTRYLFLCEHSYATSLCRMNELVDRFD